MTDLLRTIQGDALEVLRGLPDESVQMCCTSPPYWNLRDYGTATWEGGEDDCDHSTYRSRGDDIQPGDKQGTSAGSRPNTQKICTCGAWRVDSQLGLEATPDEYVEKLVTVFAEVRRVLRKDGTLFLNLGDSYFGSGKGPTGHNGIGNQVKRQGFESANALRAQGCGNGGRAEQGYQESDPSSESLDDEHIDSWWTSISDNDARLAVSQSHESCHQIRACTEALRGHLPIVDSSALPQTRQSLTAILDRVRSALPAIERLHALLASKPAVFSPQQPENYRPLDMLSVFLSSLRSLVSCVQWCVYKSGASAETFDYNEDSVLPFAELADHIQCTGGCCSLLVSWLDYKPQCSVRKQLNLKPKDLIGIPWLVAFALRKDGWYLRSDIVWAKKNCMPESVTDRPTHSHEYIFLLSKSQRYYYDHEAIKEPAIYDVDGTGTASRKARARVGLKSHPTNERAGIRPGGFRDAAKMNGKSGDKQAGHSRRHAGFNARWDEAEREEQITGMRNKRDVWTVAPAMYPEAHFATYPPELITPCVLVGCPVGGTVIDPFAGSGTTGKVAIELGRKAILIELNPEYHKLINNRCKTTIGLPLTA